MTAADPVLAAGAVTFRRVGKDTQVLVIHRPKYDDWSFPKGKLDPGESARTAAVREVLEETGLPIRLGPPLGPQVYTVGNGADRPKYVRYWVGRALDDDEVGDFTPTVEVDEVRWVAPDEAGDLLTHDHDRETLREASAYSRKSAPLIVLRHAHALPRKEWMHNDHRRTLADEGLAQAERLAALFDAYGVELLVSSSSDRCWGTLQPYALEHDLEIDVTDALTEEGGTEEDVADEVNDLLELGESAVLCTHRPILPLVFESLGIHSPALEPAAAMVVHHRKGGIVALELVPSPDLSE